MSGDLFSAGFAWDDVAPAATPRATRPVEAASTSAARMSRVFATPAATLDAPSFSGDFAWQDDAVASVASVAKDRRAAEVSQADVAVDATDGATPKTADLRGPAAYHAPGVADVASVANWSAGIEAVRGATPPAGWNGFDWRRMISDARALIANWGADLIAEGWSTIDVFGVSADPRARRLDQVGLCRLIKGGSVEAIDQHTALIRVSATDIHTFDRRLVAAGGVPFWFWMGCLSARQPGEGVRGSACRAYPGPPAPVNRLEESGDRKCEKAG